MQFPNSIHAEGWNPKLDLGASSQSMKPLHAQGNGPMPRHHMPLVLLGVTLSLVAGAAALSTIFSPKAAETTWQAMDGLAAPGAGSNQVAQTLPSPHAASEALMAEGAQPLSAPALEQPASAAEPVNTVKSEARDLTPPPERKAKTLPLPAAEPAPTPLLPPVIDPSVQDTLPAPVPVAPPVVTPAATPASSPASAPPAPLPASAPPSSPASDPPKSEPKPLPPVEPPAKVDTPDAPKAPPVQG